MIPQNQIYYRTEIYLHSFDVMSKLFFSGDQKGEKSLYEQVQILSEDVQKT